MLNSIKRFFKNYPILSIVGSIGLVAFLGYLVLVVMVLRPINMKNGRMQSYDKNWSEIEANINFVHIGTTLDSVKILLGRSDKRFTKDDSTIIYSYQQYGTIAPHWVYDIHVFNDSVIKIDAYDW